jgi:hypothetical protein
VKRLRVLAAVVAGACVLVACQRDDLPTVDRPHAAVVLTGAQVPALQGAPPNRIVAFRFVYGSWLQVPVQVDERAVLDLSKPKNGTPTGKTALFYTDANTFTGADPNAAFDANDEVVFMVKDAFGKARNIDDDERNVHYTLANPPHVVPGSGVEVRLDDPLGDDAQSWVYLFRSDGTLDPAAGQARVQYSFNLLSGDYKTTYNIASGPNPENSRVTTANYTVHFADRWVEDELKVLAGNANEADILDRHKAGFADTCGRTEDTFKTGAGAIIANKVGPVRAIRSYLGANSGTYTQRDHLMYESFTDTVTLLRVHAIPPLRDWFDYSPAAGGMTFSASNVPGVPVDGVPDTVTTANPTWQMVTGAQGSVVHTAMVDSNIPDLAASLRQYYRDDATPTETQCTGDAFQYGASGTEIAMNVPCTDPTQGCTLFMTSTRRTTYLPPNAPASTANALAQQTSTPLSVATSAFAP